MTYNSENTVITFSAPTDNKEVKMEKQAGDPDKELPLQQMLVLH